MAYQLALPLSWGIHNVFHASLLLPYKETTAHGPNFTRPPPDLIEGEEEYEVEAVINHRHYRCQHQLQYLIQWKGYPSSDNTWEAAENVHADDLVKEYHRCQPLVSLKGKANQGTRKLVCTLQLFATTPSPTHRITEWLLNSKQARNSLHTPTDFQQGSRSLLRALSRPWVSPSSKSCRRLSLVLALTMHGGSSKMSPTSCGNFGKFNGTSDPQQASLTTLRHALMTVTMKKTVSIPTHSKTSLCTTVPPSSGRGCPL